MNKELFETLCLIKESIDKLSKRQQTIFFNKFKKKFEYTENKTGVYIDLRKMHCDVAMIIKQWLLNQPIDLFN